MLKNTRLIQGKVSVFCLDFKIYLRSMVIRDRKLEFLTKLNQRKPLKSTSSVKKSASSLKKSTKPADNFGEKVILIFLRKAEQINERFTAIDRAITDVISIQSAILEFSETDEKLYSSYNDIKSEIVVLANNLNGLEKSYDARDFPGSPTELRICNTQILTLKKKLGSCVSYYFSIQEEYKERCKARVRRQAQIAGVDLSKINLDSIMSKKTEVFLKQAIPDYDVSHYYLAEVKKRHQEFLKIERNIEELRDLFFDLALVVQVDFALIDRVDRHSIAITSIIAQAKDNAKHYRSALRVKKYKKFIALGCIVVLLVVGFMVLLVFLI